MKNILLIIILVFGCGDVSQPKPRGKLSLNYKKPDYKLNDLANQFNFQYNSDAKINIAPNGQSLFYPKLKATLYLSNKE